MSHLDQSVQHQCCNVGFGAAVFVASVTTIVVLASFSGVQAIPGAQVNVLVMIDALMFAAIAWGIRRHSRFAAIAGLALFVIEKAGGPPLADPGSWLVAIGLTGCFAAGTFGVFSFHRSAYATVSTGNLPHPTQPYS